MALPPPCRALDALQAILGITGPITGITITMRVLDAFRAILDYPDGTREEMLLTWDHARALNLEPPGVEQADKQGVQLIR